MDYSYEILKIEPRHKFLTVRYFADGKDDFFKNFNPTSFANDDIVGIIKNFFPTVKEHWEYQDGVDETASVLEVGNTATITYSDPSPVEATTEEKATIVRNHRNSLLFETDWMMMSDTPAPSQAWLDYRQALRDVTDQEGFPTTVTWPTKPE